MYAKQIYNTLNKLVESDIQNGRTKGFQYLDYREVRCGSEYAFRLPRGYNCRKVHEALDSLIAAVGAPVDLIDRGGAVVVRVVEKDFPKKIGYKPDDLLPDRILIGYDRLMKPIYHPLNTHLLVGGASGSGKTDGLRFWLYQLVLQGYDIRICDLKGFSFFPFEPLPSIHIAKSLRESHDILQDGVDELYNRKERVIRSRSRDIIKTFKPIVYVIDEAAALAPKQNAGLAKKLAQNCDDAISFFGQQAREPRMFMIYCTQRPSMDVINLQFRANVEAMIAFRCRDEQNSKMILGREGAEQINPTTPGRCIYTYDRDYTLQVPFIGDDSKWSELLQPLRTEVIDHGRSNRAETPRIYLDGVVQSADSDDEANRHVKHFDQPEQKGIVPAAGAGDGGTGQKRVSPKRKNMDAHTGRPETPEVYTDELE